MIGYLIAGKAALDMFGQYQAGQLQQQAYNHEAAMRELQAEQIGLQGQYAVAVEKERLTQTLAMQNLLSAATGRGGGSQEAIMQTSLRNFEQTKEGIELNVTSQKIANLMGAESLRTSGELAASQGLMGALSSGAESALLYEQYVGF